jgi:DNA helicase II / ATP-dependent DNA helicase PcrA
MPSPNLIVIAAAGAGKTTWIVDDALQHPERRVLFVTYTDQNTEEIRKVFYKRFGRIPSNVTIMPWFTFLLHDVVRPYQNYLYSRRVESIMLANGKSTRGIKADDIGRYYFAGGEFIYTDKAALFGLKCNETTGGKVIDRLEALYDHIYVDEVQDLAGYDLELLDELLRSKITITAVGDQRQATLRTNYSPKNAKFTGPAIVEKFREWEKKGLCRIEEMAGSHRCQQPICDVADSLYPGFPKTKSLNEEAPEHVGVFVIGSTDVLAYVKRFGAQALRHSVRTDCQGLEALNFGVAKGQTFERVMIFPTGPIRKYLLTGDSSHVEASLEKLYVGITRARSSVAFVHDGECKVAGISRHELIEEDLRAELGDEEGLAKAS